MQRENGKKRVGGALILGAAIWIGQETIAWAWNRALDFASDGFSGVTVAAFPWQSALVAIMAVLGAFLAFWPSTKPKAAKAVSEAEIYYALWCEADTFLGRVRYQRGLQWHERTRGNFNRAENPGDIARDGISLILKFEKSGLPVPLFDAEICAEQFVIGCADYFGSLSALMRDGHVDVVKSIAPDAAENAVKTAKRFKPDDWWYDTHGRY